MQVADSSCFKSFFSFLFPDKFKFTPYIVLSMGCLLSGIYLYETKKPGKKWREINVLPQNSGSRRAWTRAREKIWRQILDCFQVLPLTQLRCKLTIATFCKRFPCESLVRNLILPSSSLCLSWDVNNFLISCTRRSISQIAIQISSFSLYSMRYDFSFAFFWLKIHDQCDLIDFKLGILRVRFQNVPRAFQSTLCSKGCCQWGPS